jgi:hypothetical protein
MGKMAKRGFSRAAIIETQCRIKKRATEVCEDTKCGVEFAGHKEVGCDKIPGNDS